MNVMAFQITFISTGYKRFVQADKNIKSTLRIIDIY